MRVSASTSMPESGSSISTTRGSMARMLASSMRLRSPPEQRLVHGARRVLLGVEPHAAQHALAPSRGSWTLAPGQDEPVDAQTLEPRRLLPGERDAAAGALVHRQVLDGLAVQQDLALQVPVVRAGP